MLINLKMIESNEGPIDNILTRVRTNNSTISKSFTFPDTATLESFINQFANPTSFSDMECTKFSLYELRSFNVINSSTTKNFIQNYNGIWETNSSFINKITTQDLNARYLNDFNSVKSLFDNLGVNEYIMSQLEYIDCGYIATHYESTISGLIEMYNKYR